MTDFASELTQLCVGKDPAEVASRLKCSVATLWRWQNGRSKPRKRDHVRRLKRFGVPAHLLDSPTSSTRRAVAADNGQRGAA